MEAQLKKNRRGKPRNLFEESKIPCNFVFIILLLMIFRWKMKLFVYPSRLVLLTGAALVGTMGFVAGIIGILHWRERVRTKDYTIKTPERFILCPKDFILWRHMTSYIITKSICAIYTCHTIKKFKMVTLIFDLWPWPSNSSTILPKAMSTPNFRFVSQTVQPWTFRFVSQTVQPWEW